MALTPRQRQFYQALVALCRVSGRSVHYTAVARALGVSPFSAYDMLKVLESKGVASSEYVLESSSPGPGRSAIRFFPRSAPGGAGPAADAAEEAEWRRLRQRLLQRLGEAKGANGPELLAEMLARLSECTSPLSYCAGVIAALLVNLQASGSECLARRRQNVLQSLVSGSEAGLGALAGLSIGASLTRLRGSPAAESLLQPVCRFQDHLSALSQESRQRLADFAHEALSALDNPVPHARAAE